MPTEPVPDRLVVLTFDDGAKSDAEFVAPLLKQHGFGATFFITEGLTFLSNKTSRLTWNEVRGLHEDGFEIGNHTKNHAGVDRQSPEEFRADVGDASNTASPIRSRSATRGTAMRRTRLGFSATWAIGSPAEAKRQSSQRTPSEAGLTTPRSITPFSFRRRRRRGRTGRSRTSSTP